ncbi:MAG: GNAT family N-acetyltransferase, partial [Gammaproteobacteria bacterium]|nr:GNAT family N-acetyltransferase [Gammaproteobacteria bacterium]
PDRLDLEQPLLEWAIGRGRSLVVASKHPEKVIRVSVEEHRDRRRSLLQASGFVEARAFVDMERSLADDLPESRPLPDGVEIVPWTPDHDAAARLVSNASFADHWGSLPIDPETWGSSVLDDDVTRRDLSFLAVAEGVAIAICLIEVDLEEDPFRMWVERVGTVPQWQRRGLASELLSRSMRAAAATGLLTAGLSVDEESRFDATALYSGLGYTVKNRSITYVLEDPS